eukprot:TRINITY_DN18541_c0_g1_i1.p1 TRINITY_DN18541_c0_g1~~TRINITY_DN18541_c0_g1_i1.p1  ORF type:complete len:587 (-),score=70.79 TRINITY_DN18541_c0_g1_i1:113-1873(-)
MGAHVSFSCLDGGSHADAVEPDEGERRELITDSPRVARPTIKSILEALKAGGGVLKAPASVDNADFLVLLDTYLPELQIYKEGQIQTSPAVHEKPGSHAEYFRTIGAIIALLAAYAAVHDDAFGLESVSEGKRGPMSLDQVPGKFISMGKKPKEYEAFCKQFASYVPTEEDWWAMLVLLAVHDVGKSDKFREKVNSTVTEDLRTDDHDIVLAYALRDTKLVAELLPTVSSLSERHKEALAVGFGTTFQLPQLGQGEMATCDLRGLLEIPQKYIDSSVLRLYFYHSIFDVAGASCTEDFIYPLALQPVYIGFGKAMGELLETLNERQRSNSLKHDESASEHAFEDSHLYFDFLYVNFQTAYRDFNEKVFSSLCANLDFKLCVGLAMLRILALSRNTYRNPQALLDALQSGNHKVVVDELAGSAPTPQIMLYYGPDMFRMGLGEGALLDDPDGSNVVAGLHALAVAFSHARKALRDAPKSWAPKRNFQVNVHPIVLKIKEKGKSWTGARELLPLLKNAYVQSNSMFSEGIFILRDKPGLRRSGTLDTTSSNVSEVSLSKGIGMKLHDHLQAALAVDHKKKVLGENKHA